MYQMAQATFPFGGTVLAPAAECMVSPVDYSSKNGKWTKMSYVANTKNPEMSFQAGTFGNKKMLPSLRKVCLEEIDSIFKQINDKGTSCLRWDSQAQKAWETLDQFRKRLKDKKETTKTLFPPGFGLPEIAHLRSKLSCKQPKKLNSSSSESAK
jgi:hypothetical protein